MSQFPSVLLSCRAGHMKYPASTWLTDTHRETGGEIEKFLLNLQESSSTLKTNTICVFTVLLFIRWPYIQTKNNQNSYLYLGYPHNFDGLLYPPSVCFKVHPFVKEALDHGRPVVALESTIITHGMPYPYNLSTAREVEEIIRRNGVVPATIGILNGCIHVGLQNNELEILAQRENVVKASRRDFPYVLSQGLSGGTTVAGTMIVAHKAGIPVFVTGGIGGVHRGGEKTFDVSADLTELGRTPVAVISAGVKSILDIGRTLEYLETQGVCVATFGGSREFPAFFTRQSGFQAPYQVPSVEDAANLIAGALTLQLGSGVLIAVPCPEEEAASGQLIEEAIQQALGESREKRITGKELTPFLLQRVNNLSRGKSLNSNIALIKNNADVGSRIALALNKIQRTQRRRDGPSQSEKALSAPRPVVIGGINVDFIAKAKDSAIVEGGQTNPSAVRQTFGGVGRNLADCLSRLGKTPLFISAVGKDEHSESVLRYCRHMDMSGVYQLDGHNTATYCVVVTGSGEVKLGLGDMEIHQQITEQYVSRFKDNLCQAPVVCIDGNVPVSTIQYICQFAKEHHLAVYYEPTDVDKASKPFLSDSWRALACVSPSLRELMAISRTLGHPVPADLPSKPEDVIETAVGLVLPLLRELHCVVVTLGQHGVLVCGQSVDGSVSLHPGAYSKTTAGELCATHYPAIPVPVEEIVNVSGAGDSLMAGIIAGLLAGEDTNTCVRMGLLAASLSLRSYEPISPAIDGTSVSMQRVQAQRWLGTKTWKLS